MKFDKGDKVTIFKIPLGVGRNIKYSDLEIGLCGIVQYAHTNNYGVKLDMEWENFYEELFRKLRKTLDNQSTL